VVWGYYSAQAKPVLKVHSGDTVRIQTLLMTSRPGNHLLVFRADDLLRLDDEARGFLKKRSRGPACLHEKAAA
jgi:hypothetical protein